MASKVALNCLADICIVPMGVGTSVSKFVTVCEKILREKDGLESQLHSYGTDVRGDWDTVFGSIKECHEKLHELGVPRITSTVKFGTRIDKVQTMEDKINSVETKLAEMDDMPEAFEDLNVENLLKKLEDKDAEISSLHSLIDELLSRM